MDSSRSYGEGDTSSAAFTAQSRGRVAVPLPAARLPAHNGGMDRVRARATGLLGALLLALLGSWVTPGSAAACDCRPISAAQALRRADAVLRGQVTATDAVGRGQDARVDVRFRVDTVWKGTVFSDQVVAFPQDQGMCGVAPEVGSTWVIYALAGVQGRGDDAVARLVTDACRGNRVSATPPAALGPGRPARPGSSDRDERALRTDRAVTRGLRTAAVVGVGLLVVAGGGLALVWRGAARRPG